MYKTKNEIINVKKTYGRGSIGYNNGNNERKSMVKRSENASRSVRTRRERWERARGAPEVMRDVGADLALAGNTRRRGGALLQKGKIVQPAHCKLSSLQYNHGFCSPI